MTSAHNAEPLTFVSSPYSLPATASLSGAVWASRFAGVCSLMRLCCCRKAWLERGPREGVHRIPSGLPTGMLGIWRACGLCRGPAEESRGSPYPVSSRVLLSHCSATHRQHCKTLWTCIKLKESRWSPCSARQASRMVLHRNCYF